MRRILIALSALSLAAVSHAQLWNGQPLPDPFSDLVTPGVDGYFVPGGGGLSEFDMDVGLDLSLAEGGTKPIGIVEANGWVNAANFAVTLEDQDRVVVTYLGKTAGWTNDFGVNFGGANAYGGGGAAYTLWSGITDTTPGFGNQYDFTVGLAVPTSIDFWLNSGGPQAPVHPSLGGFYSIFFPGSSYPDNTGEPDYAYSSRGKLFNVYDDVNEANRTLLVIAIEDWRTFDADFTDMFFAIEIYDRDGNPQFPVPEPSTYSMIGAMALLGLVAVRRFRRS